MARIVIWGQGARKTGFVLKGIHTTCALSWAGTERNRGQKGSGSSRCAAGDSDTADEDSVACVDVVRQCCPFSHHGVHAAAPPPAPAPEASSGQHSYSSQEKTEVEVT